jgi:hypothetical protein
MSYERHLLPNFFIVGAPKAGTTSLYHYLDQHPEIYMSPIKEPCHFSVEIRAENFSEEMLPGIEAEVRAQHEYLQGPMTERRVGGVGMEWADYLRLFRDVKKEKAIGEASVLYLWSKTAAETMRSKIPDAKIVMILRDPVDRAFSEYMHAVTAGVLRISFREYVEACLSYKSDKLSLWKPSLEPGLYFDSVKRYLDRFGGGNVRIFFYEDYQARQAWVLEEMFRFLGVDSSFIPDTSQRYLVPSVPRSLALGQFLKKSGLWQRGARMSPSAFRSTLKKLAVRSRGAVSVSPKDREFLHDYYREDIQKLAQLLDRDLTAWLR